MVSKISPMSTSTVEPSRVLILKSGVEAVPATPLMKTPSPSLRVRRVVPEATRLTWVPVMTPVMAVAVSPRLALVPEVPEASAMEIVPPRHRSGRSDRRKWRGWPCCPRRR